MLQNAKSGENQNRLALMSLVYGDRMWGGVKELASFGQYWGIHQETLNSERQEQLRTGDGLHLRGSGV